MAEVKVTEVKHTAYGTHEKQYVVDEQPRHSEHVVNIHAAGTGRSWDHGICGCGGDCCKGCCCNPCWACNVSHSMGEWPCIPYCFGTLGAAALRTKVRMALGIRGSLCGDILMSNICYVCVVCQMHHEMHHIGLHKEAEIKAQVDVAKECLCE